MFKDISLYAGIVYFSMVTMDNEAYYLWLNKQALYCFKQPTEVVKEQDTFPIEIEISYMDINKVQVSEQSEEWVKIYHTSNTCLPFLSASASLVF